MSNLAKSVSTAGKTKGVWEKLKSDRRPDAKKTKVFERNWSQIWGHMPNWLCRILCSLKRFGGWGADKDVTRNAGMSAVQSPITISWAKHSVRHYKETQKQWERSLPLEAYSFGGNRAITCGWGEEQWFTLSRRQTISRKGTDKRLIHAIALAWMWAMNWDSFSV